MTAAQGNGPTPLANGRKSSRSRKAGPAVAVTGAAGAIGSVLLRRLVESPAVGKVLAYDVRRGTGEGVTWRVGDVRDPVLAQRLAGMDAVVHLAVDWSLDADPSARSALNVRGTQTVVTAAAAAGVSRVVLVTSASVYGALPDNPVPLPEDAPLLAVPEGIVADLLEMERVAEDARRVHPGLEVVVVRPAALVGPGVDTLVTRHFSAPRLLSIKDTSPAWQFCHIDDLASALVVAATTPLPHVVTVGSDGYLDQRRIEEISGMKRVEVPAALALATAERLHRVGVTPAPASELAYAMHPLVVSSATLRGLGWRPEHTNEDNLEAVLAEVRGATSIAGRRIGKKDAAVAGASAAGATVAVLGAAAFVRAARRARGR
ncbi:MAG: NAD-dependent epimerase/dehydratase family protein [Candidatus Nanopelagicales bacterium]